MDFSMDFLLYRISPLSNNIAGVKADERDEGGAEEERGQGEHLLLPVTSSWQSHLPPSQSRYAGTQVLALRWVSGRTIIIQRDNK